MCGDPSIELDMFLFLVKVTDISESVFNKVPRKSHLNSGFSITEMTSQGGQVYNLLAEVSEHGHTSMSCNMALYGTYTRLDLSLPGAQIYELSENSESNFSPPKVTL